ncbi:hypothetical protein F5Y17DRAFT_472905 [Xylariaceae sp. FL0594]|nr:hypothetical protein F5Y17DRAFT_472905 [Xylariaceae sp. FL0594]
MDDTFFHSTADTKSGVTKPSVILFGPQGTDWAQESNSRLQQALLGDHDFGFLRTGLQELGNLDALLKDTELGVAIGPSGSLARDIDILRGFASGNTLLDPDSCSNAVRATLTVANHVRHLMEKARSGDETVVSSIRTAASAQGFCIGFLVAAAFAVSRSRPEFERNVIVALRLALLIGSIVDQQEGASAAVAIAVRCKSLVQRGQLDEVLAQFDSAYVSCITDILSLTVTVASADSVLLTTKLTESCIGATTLNVHGSYHTYKHTETANTLKKLSASSHELQFSTASSSTLRLPLRSTAAGELVTSASLGDVAIDSILCHQAQWYQTVMNSTQGLTDVEFLPIGSDSCVPHSLLCNTGNRTNYDQPFEGRCATGEIAVVGMACRFPQASTVDEFWRLLTAGKTTVGKVPAERFETTHVRRQPKLDTYWGSFISQCDVFDHLFFGISGREAKSMDPQQRLALQVAYEALESSGYHSLSEADRPEDVGCYVGVGSVEYENNVASEDANAFSATGTLRAFISGRISHYFGVERPLPHVGYCVLVLGRGECSMALAGGVNIITSPTLHQNLSAASFLNPDGASRAFDAAANGYCRGEGAGLIVLKPLKKALLDCDNIIGVIAGSAINQNANRTSITVPDSGSQGQLYTRVLSMAGLDADMVGYVEAHGTGTQVGDPIEYESIRRALANDEAAPTFFVGSVKDNIGHTEAASGAAGVIESLLMMQRGAIPTQANFTTLNPKIPESMARKICVPTETRPWEASPKVALVNNYGAAGSNAAILIREYEAVALLPESYPGGTFPITLAARSEESLGRYVDSLRSYLVNQRPLVPLVAQNISRRVNPKLLHRTAFSVSTLDGLIEALQEDVTVAIVEPARPAILCFGGQTGQMVCVSRALYEGSDFFRKHLDDCAATCIALGLPSILPRIFNSAVVDDIVLLHCMLLSLQYSCAKSWTDSGIRFDALIGHSFGQIVALCVADSISLRDAFRFISRRARLVQEKWDSSDKGAMLAVECSPAEMQRVRSRVQATGDHRIDVACYNGVRSFVLSGNKPSIEKAREECAAFKVTDLNNTYAYHSYMTDPLIPELIPVAETIECRPPRTHRLSSRFPNAIWLEAGSATPVVSMARRVVQAGQRSGLFIPIDIGGPKASESLSEAVCKLWMSGASGKHWAFHRSSNRRYKSLDVPPYQFETHRQWIDLNVKPSTSLVGVPQPRTDEHDLVTLDPGCKAPGEFSFSVDTSTLLFVLATRGHAVAGRGLCPASLYVEMAATAARKASRNSPPGRESVAVVEAMAMSAPLSAHAPPVVSLHLHEMGLASWEFSIYSRAKHDGRRTDHAKGVIRTDSSPADHRLALLGKVFPLSRVCRHLDSDLTEGISGSLIYKTFSEVVDYAEYYRGVKPLASLGQEVAGIVELPSQSQGILGESQTACDPISLDNFLQVAGIHVNCLCPPTRGEVFMCTGIDEIIFSGAFHAAERPNHRWQVYSRYEPALRSTVRNDIFVYDQASQKMVVAILGATFRSVPFKTLMRNLSRLSIQITDMQYSKNDEQASELAHDSGYQTNTSSSAASFTDHSPRQSEDTADDLAIGTSMEEEHGAIGSDTTQPQIKSGISVQSVAQVIARVMEIPVGEVKPTSTMEELGIDSLVATELLSDLQKAFNGSITPTELQSVPNARRLVDHLIGRHSHHCPLPASKEADENSMKSSSEIEAPLRQDTAELTNRCFQEARGSYDHLAAQTSFMGYYDGPFQLQSRLVAQYVVEAMASMGVDLDSMHPGDMLSPSSIPSLPRHGKLVSQLLNILEKAGLVEAASRPEGVSFRRSSKQVPRETAARLHEEMLTTYPQHARETMLLHTTGRKLASCLLGTADPIALIFKDADGRALLEDVYANAPMFKTGTLLLADYLASVLQSLAPNREIRILEIGAGTGATTRYLVERLAAVVGSSTSSSSRLSYTFTDLSPSLVAAARRKFDKWAFMEYAVLDIGQESPARFRNRYDIVISTNCIHATPDLVRSTTQIRQTLHEDGVLCLVELTRDLFWLTSCWKNDLTAAGFETVDWSDGSSRESSVLRVITAWPSKVPSEGNHPVLPIRETFTYKTVDGLDLKADLYYPAEADYVSRASRPIALMIHGGGHVMLTREDVRPRQTKLLLDNGFLPISIDYRLCPELTITEGPMADGADSFIWARTTLPHVQNRRRADVRISAEKAVAVGWSTGGHLAMTLAWTCSDAPPPDAILAFYNPSDYEDPFWMRENIPQGSVVTTADNNTPGSVIIGDTYDLDEDTLKKAVQDCPIAGYTVPATEIPIGGWLAPRVARCRLLLYMNWHGRTLHVLLGGLAKNKNKNKYNSTTTSSSSSIHTTPSPAEISSISPLSHIRAGRYKTPTFLIHPRDDDLVPCAQTKRTYEALRTAGVLGSELRVVENAPHLFDIYPAFKADEQAQRAVRDGYRFLCERVGLGFREIGGRL